MSGVLVTGATGFLGSAVVRRLNERGVRPRVLELRDSDPVLLGQLDVEVADGDLEDPLSLTAACAGIDTVLHADFEVRMGGGPRTVAEMRRVNVLGSERLLGAAAAAGVQTAVVISSALAVGVNNRAEPLDESADPAAHVLDLPYAVLRREAERASLALARPGFAVMAVCPSFTLGPEDPVGAPANKLLSAVIAGRMRAAVPVGFGCLDVRDFADGMLLAAERGQSGRRYLLSGENVTSGGFLEQAAAIAGVPAPRFQLPPALLHAAVAVVGLASRLRRREPPVTRDVLQIIGRYAWYDTARARAELGWSPRPLARTLEDTVAWLRATGGPRRTGREARS
ncbi:NAD-dependent epimerase/dehydratase family protein [Modestobacter excelsi]|uniref:NAD-dependent epimerase/dehydratase family protein n=1 Tax=Modestobacter excelsi TaxID=2213161 RepID=UPI001C20E242|nr:NAD-dependent epimerase/dehydratase family protein [Modestobacter excelsi]